MSSNSNSVPVIAPPGYVWKGTRWVQIPHPGDPTDTLYQWSPKNTETVTWGGRQLGWGVEYAPNDEVRDIIHDRLYGPYDYKLGDPMYQLVTEGEWIDQHPVKDDATDTLHNWNQGVKPSELEDWPNMKWVWRPTYGRGSQGVWMREWLPGYPKDPTDTTHFDPRDPAGLFLPKTRRAPVLPAVVNRSYFPRRSKMAYMRRRSTSRRVYRRRPVYRRTRVVRRMRR